MGSSTKNYLQFSDIMAISKLVKAELDKLKIPYQTIHSRKSALRKKVKNAISSETALYIVAADEGIDVHKLLPKDGKEKELESFKIARATYDFDNPEIKRKPKLKIDEKKNGDTKSPYDTPLIQYNLDSELIRDAKLRKPYRSAVREALGTLEERMRTLLGLDETVHGVDLVTAAQNAGVFNRKNQAESQGLNMLFRGAVQWMRNPPSHRKINYSKEEAFKIILFSDYLIKLFEDLFHKRI